MLEPEQHITNKFTPCQTCIYLRRCFFSPATLAAFAGFATTASAALAGLTAALACATATAALAAGATAGLFLFLFFCTPAAILAGAAAMAPFFSVDFVNLAILCVCVLGSLRVGAGSCLCLCNHRGTEGLVGSEFFVFFLVGTDRPARVKLANEMNVFSAKARARARVRLSNVPSR